MLFVHFEDMKTKPGQVVLDVCAFLGVCLAAEQIEDVLKHTSFQFMKTADGGQAFQPRSLSGGVSKGHSLDQFEFIRNGEVTTTQKIKPESKPENAKLTLTEMQRTAVYAYCEMQLRELSSPYLPLFELYYKP